MAAPYAAYMIDARNGQELYSKNGNQRLHPASLTKMMTLYVAFQAIENGEISAETKVKISRNAASEVPSKLYLRAGSRIRLKYLIRGAAVKSANDAATAIGEAISGSEAAFAQRMTRTAKAMGMNNTRFLNAHGLTKSGHYSTARDMTILGRHLFYDYPDYYHLFSRKTVDAGVRHVNHTNTRFLNSYRGSDGIKTGYTNAAGYNLTSSAQRGSVRLIATVFGGESTSRRNAKMAALLDKGFKKARRQVAIVKPQRPNYAQTANGAAPGAFGKRIIIATAPKQTPLPKLRPATHKSASDAPAPLIALNGAAQPVFKGLQDDILALVGEAQNVSVPHGNSDVNTEMSASNQTLAAAPSTPQEPVLRPMQFIKVAAQSEASLLPRRLAPPRIITGASTDRSAQWGIRVGHYTTRFDAEKALLKSALAETKLLDGTGRAIETSRRGFSAKFTGLSKDNATKACARLQVRQYSCEVTGQ